MHATNVTFSNVIRGGHASASWEVPVENAYLIPHYRLRRGQWVVLYDGEHELWEGEILTVRPVIDLTGQHKLQVTGGGLISVAAKRRDLTKTWVRRGGGGWRVHQDANKSGEYTVGSDGTLQLLVRKGAKEFYIVPMRAVYYLDGLLSDDYISHVDYVCDYDVTYDGTYHWSFTLSCDDQSLSKADASATGETGSLTLSAPYVAKAAELVLSGYDSSGVNSVFTDKYVAFPTMDVFGSSQTAKIRIDEAMCDVATRTGLAVSASSSQIGLAVDDLWVEKTDAASTLDMLGKMHAQAVEYGFWDERTFTAGPVPRRPDNLAEVVVVGGGLSGLKSWDVASTEDEYPEYVCVYFKNMDDDDYPEGMVRALWLPSDPGDTADVRVEVADFSNLILSDAAASAIGMQLLGAATASYTLPGGAVFAVHPEYADASYSAGNNSDPTEDYAQIGPDAATGTLTGFGYTTTDGWAGTNSPLDPTCLVFDGTTEVDFGDYAAADFGTGAFSVAGWFRLDATGAAQVIAGKWATGTGWLLWVSATNNLCAWVGESASIYHVAADSHELVADTWYFGTLTWSGTSTHTLTVYLSAVSDMAVELVLGSFSAGVSNAASLKLGAA